MDAFNKVLYYLLKSGLSEEEAVELLIEFIYEQDSFMIKFNGVEQ